MSNIDAKLEKVENLLKDIKEDINKKSINVKEIDSEAIRRIVKEELSKIDFGNGVKIVIPPPEYILEKFQEAEIRRWENKLKELDDEHLKVGAFVLGLGHMVLRGEIIGKVFGQEFMGAGYAEKNKIINDLVGLGVFRTDKAKRIYPYVEDLIKDSMKTYNLSEEKIKNMIDRILRIFISKIDDLK